MNNAEGSGVSHVRIADAAILFAASLVALSAILLSPLSVHADDGPSQLLWGDATYDPYTGAVITSDQIYIQDGGTYPVPIGVSKGAAAQIQNIQGGYVTQYPSIAYGSLYFLPNPGHSSERDFITTIGGSNGTTTLAWSKPGTYELDVYKAQGPVFSDRLPYWQSILRALVGMPAYAQTADPPYETIRFTIVDEDAGPKESNVLFIPGIELSRLYTSSGGTERQLWEPGFFSDQADVRSLYLDKNGHSINPVYTKANAAIDTQGAYAAAGITIYSDDVYKTFLQQLADLKASSTIADYLVFPYDWRMSPDDIVNYGVQYDDGTHYLDQELVALAATSKTGKVTIIGHSNGGLVAKELMIKLQSEGQANLVDKVILVDVPQTGTPEAVAAMLHGDFQKIPDPVGFMASEATARGLAENMPDAYDLLPSAAYFAKVATPVVDLSSAPALKSTSGVSGNTIASASNLAHFITGTGGRKKPSFGDTETPDVLSGALLASSTALHASLDAWQPPAGVQVIQIAGWGLDTPSEVTYSEEQIAQCQNGSCAIVPATRHVVDMTEDGDGTVVVPSELASANWPTYYISISAYNHANETKFNHANITETSSFQNLFALILNSTSSSPLPAFVTTTQPSESSNGNNLRLRVLSPVSLDAYDSAGNHTGMAANPNPQSDDLYVENQIPGSYYQQYGEGQYIGLPADGNYHIVLHGLDTGTFTFEVTPVSGGIAGTPVTFADVPVTASSTASINLVGSAPASTTLALDVNGDGIIDTTIASSSQTTDPLGYAQIVKSSIALMDIGAPVQQQLQAKLINTIYLLTKVDKWDMDDADAIDTAKADKVSVRVTRKLGKIEAYLANEIGKPVSKRVKDERITQSQAAAIIDMIEQLKVLVNAQIL